MRNIKLFYDNVVLKTHFQRWIIITLNSFKLIWIFVFFIVKKRLIPYNKIDTDYTGKFDVALNNKHVLRKCLKALDKVHVKTWSLVSRYFHI